MVGDSASGRLSYGLRRGAKAAWLACSLLGGFAACFPEESARNFHAPPPEQHGAAAWIQTDGRGRRSRDAGAREAHEDRLIKLFTSGLSALFLCQSRVLGARLVGSRSLTAST